MNASSVILCHNHPSGNLQASDADKQITKKIIQAGGLFDIQIFDHLIISSDGFLSMQSEGLI
jgi:DNA repair protein RadC